MAGARRTTRQYEGVIGQPRTCTECGETKPVSHKTFAPSKKSRDGVHEVCRSCQGRAHRKVQTEAGVAPSLGERVYAPNKPVGFKNDPAKKWDAFAAEIDAKVEQLMELSAKSRPDTETIDRLKRELTAVTRLHGDPAGGGHMTDLDLCFRSFIRVLRPCLDGWNEFGPVHDDIFGALLSDHPATCLLASRGTGKSTLTAVYVLWRLWRDHLLKVMVVSRGETHAKRMLKHIRSLIERHPLFAALLPDPEQLDSAFQLEIGPAKDRLGMSCSLTCLGIGGQLTGNRADLIIGDDVEHSRDDTAEAVDKLEEQIAEFVHVLVPGGRQLLLGTPQSPYSLYGRLSRHDEWEVHRAVIFEEDVLDKRSKTNHRWQKTTVLSSRWPERFSDAELEQRRRQVMKREWELHYALRLDDTMDRDRPFKLSDLPVLPWSSTARTAPVRMERGDQALERLPRGSSADDDDWFLATRISKEVGPYSTVVAAVDPSSGLTSGSRDAIGLAIVGLSVGGRAVIREARGVRAKTTAEAMMEVAKTIALHGVNKLLVEQTTDGQFGYSLQQKLMQIGYPLSYTTVSTGGRTKAKRIIETVSPALATGKVFICQELLETEDAPEFVAQFTGLTLDGRKLRHDDIIDALSYALADIGPALSADEAEEEAAWSRYRAEELGMMSKRRCVYSRADLEELMDVDETEERLSRQLEVALAIQEDDFARGVQSASLTAKIARLQEQLKVVREARTRWARPADYDHREGTYR